jgi:hypothetical protein
MSGRRRVVTPAVPGGASLVRRSRMAPAGEARRSPVGVRPIRGSDVTTRLKYASSRPSMRRSFS